MDYGTDQVVVDLCAHDHSVKDSTTVTIAGKSCKTSYVGPNGALIFSLMACSLGNCRWNRTHDLSAVMQQCDLLGHQLDQSLSVPETTKSFFTKNSGLADRATKPIPTNCSRFGRGRPFRVRTLSRNILRPKIQSRHPFFFFLNCLSHLIKSNLNFGFINFLQSSFRCSNVSHKFDFCYRKE